MNPRLSQILDWLPRAQQAEWSVSKLAKLSGVSVRGLERHFLETRGQKPKVWLAEQRQTLAWELLCAGSMIKEIAVALGYAGAEHFSRDFRAYWGFCPTERCNHCEQTETCLKNGRRRTVREAGEQPAATS